MTGDEQEDFAKCKTFEDYCNFMMNHETQVGYEEAFTLINNAEEAFQLAWHSLIGDVDSYVIRAMSKCFELAKTHDNDDRDNSLHHMIIADASRFQFFYEVAFSDATLVKKLAELHGLDLT